MNDIYKNVTIAIPAHLGSERLFEKVLVDIKGKPMLLRVLDQCAKAIDKKSVYVVTPDKKIGDFVKEWGYNSLESKQGLPDGTSAIASVVDKIDAEFIVNIQADHPLIEPDLIRALIDNLIKGTSDLVTPVYRITKTIDLEDDGVAKVIRDLNGYALYFSRTAIPYVRNKKMEEWANQCPFWGHYGIYGYAKNVLQNLNNLKDSYLEKNEKLEQLRFLQNGLKILTFETDYRQFAVDTKEDLQKIWNLID